MFKSARCIDLCFAYSVDTEYELPVHLMVGPTGIQPPFVSAPVQTMVWDTSDV